MNCNVGSVKQCYGCGVCAASCPKNIISIELNGDGFYFPRILNPNDCVECGICVNVCSFRYEECALVDRKIKSWAAWSNDDEVRRKCSSGGVAFEIGRQLMNQGYKVVGCRYNIDKQIAEHYIATTVDELIQSIGSKYIQSYTADAFKIINRRGEKEVFDYIDRVYKQLNLPIVFFNAWGGQKSNYKEMRVPVKGPNEFLYLFSHADYVITDSFHGTAFSLIFQKPFITCIQSKESQDSRVTDLLDEIGAIDHAVVYNKKDELPSQNIDLNVVKKIEKYRKHSLDWLIKNIESKE